MKVTQSQQEDILTYLRRCLDDANDFYTSRLQGAYSERQDVIDAAAEYYSTKFPNLANIPLTSSDVSDTIGWIMPALMEIFSSTDDVVTVKPSSGNDNARAAGMQDLLNYQTERLNNGFMNRYFWILSALQYNIGFKKKTWLRTSETEQKTGVFDSQEINSLEQLPRVRITTETLLAPGDYDLALSPLYQVDYEVTSVLKNQPLDEIIPVTELRWNSSAKNLKDATFVAHKKTVTIDHLLARQREGVYFAVDTVRDAVGLPQTDLLEARLRDNVGPERYTSADLRREVNIYECYVKYDMDNQEELGDWIFTVAGEAEVLIGVQENTLGRFHPFLDLVAMPDPWNVVPRKGLVELLAEIQHISTALTRLFVRHLAISNEGRRFVNKNVVDQDDLINQSIDVAVDGDPRLAVFPMPLTNMSPATMPFFEYLQSKLRRSVGIGEYNTGGDARQLNPTATGVTALIDQANKKINLMAQIMAHYFVEEYRYQIALNQRFIDEPQVFRLLDRDIRIDPADLDGNFDLVVNTGVGTANKNADIQNTQLVIGTLEKVAAAIPGMVTPDKVYNIVKLLLEQMGRKNVDDYINTPEFIQRLQAGQSSREASGGAENITAALDKMIIPAQIQALARLGINITPQDYLTDARIKALLAQGGETGGNQGTAYQPAPAGMPVFRGGPQGQAVPPPTHRIAPV
ncbi:MAG: hypothetical protein P4N59_25605 [Negativicutes bacterium]|nr:hypothetical protein [Negativicutes bacterium]